MKVSFHARGYGPSFSCTYRTSEVEWPQDYAVANGPNMKLRGDSFTVYSHPIRLKYAEVNLNGQADVPLPDDVIEAFDGSVMAITGYEVGGVKREARSVGSSS
jgi:hypothetical protein